MSRPLNSANTKALPLSLNDIEFVARICALSVAGVMGLGLWFLMVI